MTTVRQDIQPTTVAQPAPINGFPVRTNLRAGLAWDDLDDKAKALWGQLTSAITSATSTLNAGSKDTKPAA